jgi:hypothetical protein
MSHSSLRSLLALAAATFSSSVFAIPFSFSYQFMPDFAGDAGPLISGTFYANRTGDFVDPLSITELHVKIDGVTVPPSSVQFFLFGRDVPTGGWTASPVLAITGPNTTLFDNNFGFADSDVAGGDGSADFIFYLVPADPNVGAFLYSGALGVGATDSDPDLGTWNLTEGSGPTPLPEGGSTGAALFAMLATLAVIRQRWR